MSIFWTLLSFVVMFIVIGGLYALFRTYVFTKVRVSKWIILSIALAIFALQMFCQYSLKIVNGPFNMGLTILVVLFALWFFDILQTGGPKKQDKKIVIKPKAKPNRVKNRKK